ncbi:MAG: hypothetical protein KME26_15800 [Oscillatoria princeps RMCB-10]|nr:hypothetical protein [Oscillatoria princeps RMCB-10]
MHRQQCPALFIAETQKVLGVPVGPVCSWALAPPAPSFDRHPAHTGTVVAPGKSV